VLYPNQSSSILRSAAWADGLVEIQEHSQLKEGDPVPFISFAELLG
jgi:molybdopterin molybdotransferase